MSIILIFLFTFQILLLDRFYEMVKRNDIINVANKIEKNIGNSNIEDYIQQKSQSNEMCIMVVKESDILSLNSNIGCPMHRLTKEDLNYYINQTNTNGGSLLVETFVPTFDFRQHENTQSYSQEKGFDSLMYFKSVTYEDVNYFIIVNSNITPINATTRTLSIQLFFISIVVVISTILLTYILTKRFIKPIEDVNSAAKSLYNGKYSSIEKINSKEIYELNNTLINASNEINKADKAKRDLIANVSHDLRTPLTMISGYGEMMLDFPEEKTDENIKVIVDETKRLSSLVNDLLDFSKLQENKIKLESNNFNLSELIKNVLTKYNFYIQSEGFEITYNYENEVIINGDDLRISQVMHNFISNAINYSSDIKKIIVNQIVKDNFVRIEVIDFGKGIEKESIPFIWDRYYKVDKEHIRSSTGSGIGLAIAKEILELHNFKYGVISDLEKGSTFYFETPVIEIL